MSDIPAQIEEVLKFSDNTWESIQHYLLHQPNPFILKQMTEKMKLPPEKLPSNVVSIYGNRWFGQHSAEHRFELRRYFAQRTAAGSAFRFRHGLDLDQHGHGFGAAQCLQDR